MTQPYRFMRLVGEPIVVGKLTKDFNVERDSAKVIQELIRILDESPEPIYDIADIDELSFAFTDIASALATLTDEPQILRHPRLRKLIAVTNDRVIKLGLDALRQVQYGGFHVGVYSSVEEALAAVRKEIQGSKA